MKRRTGRIVGLAALLLAVAAAATLPSPAADGKATGKGSPPAQAVDLNQAGEQELIAIPGIGPALAKRIVEFREANGPYRRIEDVMKVKGIGEKSFQKIKPFIKVGKTKP
jgi:competence protein ComEA